MNSLIGLPQTEVGLVVTPVDTMFGVACCLLLGRLRLPQTEVGLVVTPVDTMFGVACCLLL